MAIFHSFLYVYQRVPPITMVILLQNGSGFFYTGALVQLVQASSEQVDSCRGVEDSDGNDTII